MIPENIRILIAQAKRLTEDYESKHSRTILDQSIEVWRELISHKELPNNLKPAVLNGLGNGLWERFRCLGILGDLDEAIECAKQAVELTEEGHTDWPMCLNNLGNRLGDRFRRLDILVDLDEAIEILREVVALTEVGHADRPMYLNNLGNKLGYRFLRLGKLADLDEAIACAKQAVALTEEGHAALPIRLNNLGNKLGYRFRRLGKLADLDEAIECAQQAVALTEKGHAALPVRLNNLGNKLGYRFLRLEALEDLDEAIEMQREAVDLTEEGHAALPIRLNNLGNKLGYRFGCLGKLEDLDEAIACAKQAVALTEEGHAALPGRLNNLGNKLGDRFRHLSKQVDLDEAIGILQEAVALTVEGHVALPVRLTNLGNIHYDVEDYRQARRAFEKMVAGIEQLCAASPLKADREKMLSDNASAYARLVTCCLIEDNQEAGLRYAEAGKSRALVDALHNERTALTDLAVDDPVLADRLERAQRLRGQIDWLLEALSQPAGTDEDGQRDYIKPKEETQREVKQLLSEEDALWREIERDHPAFTLSVSAPPFTLADARALAEKEDATLVSFYRHDQGWSAFVVSGAEFTHIPLGEIDSLVERGVRLVNNLDNLYVRMSQALTAFLGELYQGLFAPLEDALPAAGGRLIMAPFGGLHLLPLSAACNPETECYLAESYQLRIVPSLGTLAALQREVEKVRLSAPAELDLLSVAYPGSEDEDDQHYLKGVMREANAISDLFPNTTTLWQEEATPEAVLAHHQQARMLNFGCHGWFNPERPEMSGLLLKGGWLTVRQVLTRMDLHRAGLVVLGACLSGRQRISGGEELTGLITAFIASRARSVVGTLWSVDDAATAELLTRFYQGVQCGERLDRALAEAQAHVRLQAGWEHPYYWAAFFLAGVAENVVHREKSTGE